MSHPLVMMGSVQETGAVRFSLLARRLADEARQMGLVVPGFRSPPRLPGAVRTIRRSGSGTTIAVRRRGRPTEAVARDLVDGIVAANGLSGDDARACRRRLLAGVMSSDLAA